MRKEPVFHCYPNMPGRMIRTEEGAYLAKDAVICGDVEIGGDSSVWFGCVIRGDDAPIRIGQSSNIQDLSCLHVDFDYPVEIGDRVTIGHKAMIHGCTIEDDCLIGMGAILLDGCRIGRGSLIAAGALIPEGAEIPENSLVMGMPGRVRGVVSEEQHERMAFGIAYYIRRAKNYL